MATKQANRADIRVIETDPHADAIAWAGPSITSITQPVKLGLFEDGSPVRVPCCGGMGCSRACPGRASPAE
ncbi:hypothetical protein [Nonomuraea sp. NPDC050643]|uniref:hypothetical protein n=1 Tax=Nonomuraea sp. NPDC050643 TaxID=3155660 RepID=UPI0033D5A087